MVPMGDLSNEYEFKYTINQPGCMSMDVMKVTLFMPPNLAAAGPDQEACDLDGLTTYTLDGNDPDVPYVGTWTVLAGSGGGTFTPNANTPDAVFDPAGYGVYLLAWSISNGACSRQDQVRITNYQPPSTANAGPNQTVVCENFVTMAAVNPMVGLGEWTVITIPPGAPAPVIASPILYNTVISNLVPGTYTFRWTTRNGLCPESFDEVNITILEQPTPANAGPDQNFCNMNSTTLAATPVIVGTGLWSIVSTPGGPLPTFVDPTDPTTMVNGLSNGVYIFRWTTTNAPCSSEDDVTIKNDALPTVADASGTATSLCYAEPMFLVGNTPLVGTGKWTQVSGGPVLILNPNSPTTQVIGFVVGGTYTFRWTITNGTCPSSEASVTITVNPVPTQVAFAGFNQFLCDETQAMLDGNPPSGGEVGTWSLLSGPNGVGFTAVDEHSFNATVTGLVGGSPNIYVLQWEVAVGTCTSSDNMSIRVWALPTTANAGSDQELCNSSTFQLNATPVTSGAGVWTQVAGPASTITNPLSPVSTVTGVTAGPSYTYRWTTKNGNVCPTSFDEVTIINRQLLAGGPTNVTVCVGASPILTSNATGGSGSYTYQWYESPGDCTAPLFTLIPGATGPNYQPLGMATTISYRVIITDANSVCSPYTAPCATVTVVPDPNISIQPMDAIVCTGATHSLSVTATGGTPLLTYQWQVSSVDCNGIWTNIAGAINSTYTTPSLTADAYYRVIVGATGLDCNPVTSSCAKITVVPDPVINTQPVGAIICTGGTHTMSVVASGNVPPGTLTYQWQRAPTNAGAWSDIAGATASSYITVPLTTTTFYRVLVRQAPASSGCETISTVVEVTVVPDPAVTVSPSSATVCIGGNATLTANATGGTPLPLDYVWEFSTVSNVGPWTIIGSGGNMYNTGPLTVTTFFRVIVSASGVGCGSATSAPVTVTVLADPFIVTQPTGTTVCTGGTPTLAVVAMGGTPVLQYQWQINTANDCASWSNIAGATSSAYTTPALTVMTSYKVLISAAGSGCDPIESACVTVDVVADPIINADPVGATICEGSTHLMSVDATGNVPPGTLTYQWQRATAIGGPYTNIPGATAQSYTAPASNLPGTYYYRVLVGQAPAGLGCSTLSAAAELIVKAQPNANAGPDQNLCLNLVSSTSLFGNTPSQGVGTWTQVSGPIGAPLANIQNDNNPNTQVTGLTDLGDYVFRWTITNAPCAADFDEVTISVELCCDPPQTYAITLKNCAMGVGMTMAEFNFTALHAAEWVTTNTFAGPVPVDLIVTFHNSLEDAQNDENPLPNLYTSVTGNIWARVERDDVNNGACFSIEVIQLLVNLRPVIELATTPITCNNSLRNDGALSVTVTSGQPNYSYVWSNMAVTQSISNLMANTYTVTVTDGNGCTASIEATLLDPICAPQIGLAKRTVQTVLNADGSANVTFEFNLENFGNVNLNNLTLIDNLAATFPASCAVTVMNLTSDDFIVDAAFNGTGNNNMLLGGNDLPVGDKGAVLLTVNVAGCGPTQTSFTNTATASGTAPDGTLTDDVSDNGSDPDPNGDNNPEGVNENDPTPVSFMQDPQIGLAKRTVQTVLNADGSANVTFEFNLENFGNVNLNNLTLIDNLAATFPASCAVTVMNLTSDDFIVNAGFTGTGNNNMLLAGNDLPVGDKGAVLLTVNVAGCGPTQTSFTNTATATGTAPSGAITDDVSDNGSDPDPNGDNNPEGVNENDPTPVSFMQDPQIGLAKRNVKTVLNADGSADVTFEFNLENFGNVNLNNLTLIDNLAASFPASCAVTVMNLTSDDFIVNAGFTGTGNNNMLLAGNDLPVGDKGAVLLTVNVAGCGPTQTSFTNTATATGTAPSGAITDDVSDNGSDPDPNGDNNPEGVNENDPTPVSFIQAPQIGLAKRTVQVQTLPNGSVDVTFEFNLENFGNVNINNLQVIDNLTLAFPATCVISVKSLTSDDFIVNAGFTGTGNNNMLLAGNDLPVGDKGAILLTINLLNCGLNQLSFLNQATVNGTAPNGTVITDPSDNGSDPDPDGDGNPNETGENDPTPVNINCTLPQTFAITLKTCAIGQGMLMGDFDFDALNAAELVTTNTFNGPVPAGLTVTFHNSLEDANTDQSPLPNVYNSQTGNIWARIESNTNPTCYSVEVIQLVVNQVPILLLNKTNETCSASNDGTASVFVTNNQGAYNYDWSNLPGTNNPAAQTGLNGGIYTVTVTDGNGCTSTGSVTVLEGPVLTMVPIPNIGPLCPGQKTIQPTLLSSTPFNPNTVYTWTGGAFAGLPNGSSTGLNPVIPGFDATTIEGVYTVTVTATLGTLPNQCSATTTFTITINDVTPPVFDNCPTSMIMIGNDPDQCSGKLNWSIPTATDECAIFVKILQTGGPLSGSVISITCPPTPQTITYTANDSNGNISTCTFQIMVVDTEKPEFDADILMPGNVTVECDAVPTNCIPRTGGVCTPLTNDDVNDNCTAPANLVVTFTETSTRGSNPALCSFYTYVLTRTWKVTDCAGNMLVHTQVINVKDTKPPTALCKNATVTLDKNGKYILNPFDVDNGSFDNCAATPFLTFSVTSVTVPGNPPTFTCANLGPNLVTLTVTDPCGNSATCTAIVTVEEGIGPCIAEVTVETSCMGMNSMGNATTLLDGQFMDLITIKSLAMMTWKLTTNNISNGQGLYNINSPAPPASPTLLPIGTLFVSGTADGFDNDGDGLTDEADEMIYYTLKVLHVDCLGYDITVSNEGGIGCGVLTTFQIQNKACYPTPYFCNIEDIYCLCTTFPIEVCEYNNAAGSVVPGSIMVNGIPTTIFDAGALGVGPHTIMATFDAGIATQNLVINGVQLGGTMQDAINDPGCKQKITKVVNIVETPTNLVCNDLVYVSMDADCKVTVSADDVLEGTYFCYDDYLVEVDKTLPYGNGPWVMAMFDASDIGKTYAYHVLHDCGSFNTCWGNIKIEDKLAPALTCPADITIACSESTGVQHTGNIGISDCSSYTTVVDDESADFGSCSNPRGQILRTWIVTDIWGNQSSCSQIITITAFDLTHVVWPADAIVNCEVTYLNPAGIASINTGEPSINGASIVGSTWCGAQVGYTDTYFYGCGGTFTILREWGVLNNCVLLGPGNPISHTQKIQVIDLGGPQFVCPPAVTVSTDPFTCCSTAALPDMIVSEGCSDILDLEAKVTGVNPNNGNIITFTVPGHLEDFSGNNYWNPDTLAVFDYTQCLPLGIYNVRYKASDRCGNTSYCNFELTIADLVPPTVSCDQFTQVALGVDGMAIIPASTFDDNTTDNCCLGTFEVARMNDNICSGTDFGPTVKFCCSDIGDTILVVFRANDCHGNSNDCMVSVLVEDKIKPTCQAPATVAVNCENFDPSLWVYGNAQVTDNCCLDTNKVYQGQIGLSHSVNYSLFDTVCNKGTITRTFRAFDCGGNSSSCTQRVIVTYSQDYFVKFPNDAIVTTCDGTGVYGEPIFFGEDCELLGVTFADDIFTVVPDACFKIERTWQIINWCTFNPNLPLLSVPNPNPNAITNHPTNLPGPTVSACGTLPPWKSTVVKINSSDPLPGTDYCSFWGDVSTNGVPNTPPDGRNEEVNGYSYKQIIKIIDGQAPTGTYVVPDCSNQNWFTANRGDLWNEMYWWDNGLQIHDLCEEPTDLCITGTDACSGANINIEYLLFLDLDGNGTMETVINSVNTGIAGYGWNNVQFNNANNPNFSGGTPSAFDERPVPFNQKWGFAIQETVVGNNKTACVRWNTQQQQNTYVVPELPHGTHKIKWFITDGCGNNKEYEYTFTVKDCKAPTVVCLNGLSVNIMPTGMISLWASDFLQYTEDNCTPNPLKISIRKCGTGTGFPVDAFGNPILQVTFDCTELGTQCVELWAIDAVGNADYCETYVIVQDNLGNCPNADRINVTGVLKTQMSEGVEEGIVSIDGTSTFAPPYSYFDLSDTLGIYAVTNSIPLAATFVIAPEKDDNPLNGVTTYDLVLMSKHILGVEPFNSPYKMIAADANKSGSITTFDIVELRKLILGIYTELPNNTSWRFVDKSFVFPNSNNPFQTAFPETISVADAMLTQIGEDFVGVKIGDVNNTSIANATMQAEDRTTGTALFDLEERSVKAGETFEVTFKAAQALKGFQFTATLNGLTAVGTVNAENVTEGNFNLTPANAMAVSINGAQEFTVRFRAEKAGKLSEMLGVSGSVTRAEAYLPAVAAGAKEGGVERLGVAFRFDGKTISGVGFELYQNQPNPFVNRTFVGFFLPEAAEATLSVYDETGRVVYQQKGQFAKGENSIQLDRALINTTGLLFYTLETATDSATKKMIQAK